MSGNSPLFKTNQHKLQITDINSSPSDTSHSCGLDCSWNKKKSSVSKTEDGMSKNVDPLRTKPRP